MQTATTLQDLLQNEDVRVEWKEGGDPQKIVRTLTAFANDYAGVGGGWVICGIVEEKDEHGFPRARPDGLDANRLRELKGRVVELCRNHVTPPLLPNVEEIPVEGEPLLRLGVAQALGQGIPTILQETRATAGKPPEFIAEPGRFTVILPAFQPEIAPAPPSPPRSERATAQRDGLILISIGADAIRPVVDGSLADLGLTDADVLVEHTSPGYVDERRWEEAARILRNTVRQCVEDTRYGRFHLFYRGPVALAPLLGALIAPNKPLVIYHHEAGRYRRVITLDRRFLITKD